MPASPPFRWQSDIQRLFPDICAKSGKWFHRQGELFRRPVETKHWREKPNDFSSVTLTKGGPNSAIFDPGEPRSMDECYWFTG
jgi:hypothetical protein